MSGDGILYYVASIPSSVCYTAKLHLTKATIGFYILTCDQLNNNHLTDNKKRNLIVHDVASWVPTMYGVSHVLSFNVLRQKSYVISTQHQNSQVNTTHRC